MIEVPKAPVQERTGGRTLAGSTPGELVAISHIEAPAEVSLRLRELGFSERAVVRLISSHAGLICSLGRARLALSQELASAIFVTPISSVRPA